MTLHWLWGYFLPVGLLLLSWGGLPPRQARRITPLAALALALATVGYWAVGFAFHLGGAHAVNPDDPALTGLDMLLAPSGGGWGLLGLTGFFLAGVEDTSGALTLFLAYLPVMASSVLLTVLALAESRRWLVVVAGALAGTVVVPIAACWMWGSGWLAHLGETLGLGHGFVDFGGSTLVLWLPGAMALGTLLLQPRATVEPAPAPPPAYFPLLANVGVLLLALGWAGWSLSGPFHTTDVTLNGARVALSAWLGMSGATLTSQLYAWLVTGKLEALMAARGIAAGWGAVLASAPFLPPWAALVVGLLAGLLFPFLLYAIHVLLRLRDTAGTVALGLTAGICGTLGVALFADGRWGQGWNRLTLESSQGVIGLIFGGGAGQLTAQLVGLLALGAWGMLWGAGLGLATRVRLPRRASTSATPPEDEATTAEEEVPET
jgi:Amt family ammonium transporter